MQSRTIADLLTNEHPLILVYSSRVLKARKQDDLRGYLLNSVRAQVLESLAKFSGSTAYAIEWPTEDDSVDALFEYWVTLTLASL